MKAVELLEAFKLFLDIPGCVYVLACDYKIVTKGLTAKFGLEENIVKSKHFFDKIIQLPFQMPINLYKINNYIENLLKEINIQFNEKDIAIYRDLIDYSIGFNPRNLKRVFNCLLLLNIVAEHEQISEKTIQYAKINELQKIIFATICLQRAYEPLFNYSII